jgi:hypothetical protein
MTFSRIAASLLVVLALSFPASGQSVISTHSGLVYFFEGSVLLGDQPLEQKFGKFPDIGEGRELRTEQGRAEVLLTPGVFLRMGENTRVRMLSASLSNTRVEFLSGSAVFEAREATPDTSAVVIYKGWQVRVPQRGIYRLDSEPSKLRVYRGEAEVVAQGNPEPVPVKDGQVLPLAGVLVAEQAGGELNDAFDHWAMERSQAIYADNATAAQILDDPGAIDSSGLGLDGLGFTGLGQGGLSYFPMTSSPGLGLASPYGLSFWSPFQPTLNSLYIRGYGAGWAYPGYVGGLHLYQLYPRRTSYPTVPTWNGGGVRPGGIQPIRSPGVTAPRTPGHPAVGVSRGGHR